MKYIDAEKLIAEIERRKNRIERRLDNIVPLKRKDTIDEEQLAKIELRDKVDKVYLNGVWITLSDVLSFIATLQQEQPIRGPHKESWIEETKKELQHEEELLDMRLETLKRIRDKKNKFQQEQPLTTEKVVEQCKKFGGNPEVIQQEQPEVDLEKVIDEFYHENLGFIISPVDTRTIVEHIAHHFYELGLNARKEEQYDTK